MARLLLAALLLCVANGNGGSLRGSNESLPAGFPGENASVGIVGDNSSANLTLSEGNVCSQLCDSFGWDNWLCEAGLCYCFDAEQHSEGVRGGC